MGAARYIGRVGGLAVALGVGMAILTGYGVASAESGSAASSSGSSESTSNSSPPSAASGVSGSTGVPESTQTSSDSSTGGSTQAESSGAASTTRRGARSAPPGVVVSTGGALTSSATSGSDGSDGTAGADKSSEDSAATTEPSPAADSTSQASSDGSTSGTSTSPQSTDDTSREDTTPRRRSTTGGLSSKSASVTATTASSPTVVSNNVDPSSTTATDEDVVEAPSITAWLSSPRALAGRAATPETTLSSLSIETSGLVTSSGLMTMQTAPPVDPVDTPTTPIGAELGIVNLVSAVLDPFAGGGPAAPVDFPADALLAAVARRELSTAPITYAPAFALTNGVITGTNNGQKNLNGNPLAFTVVGAPNAGGKVLLDSATGNFSFLPDLSVVEFRRNRDVQRIRQRDDATDCRAITDPAGGRPGAANSGVSSPGADLG